MTEVAGTASEVNEFHCPLVTYNEVSLDRCWTVRATTAYIQRILSADIIFEVPSLALVEAEALLKEKVRPF